MAVVVVTSGPGGTNTLTGVIGQWLDSVPVLYLSGQVKQETTIESCRELGLRQLGDQEINIVDMVRPVTKFAAIVQKADEIGMLLDGALFIATHGRPGPVWLDIPLDIQGALIDESKLSAYSPKDDGIAVPIILSQIDKIVGLLQKAKRPVFLAGQGIRIADVVGFACRNVEEVSAGNCICGSIRAGDVPVVRAVDERAEAVHCEVRLRVVQH